MSYADATLTPPDEVKPSCDPAGITTVTKEVAETPESKSYSLEDLREMAPSVAQALGGTGAILDLTLELTGSKLISKDSDEWYDVIGSAFTDVLAGGGDE